MLQHGEGKDENARQAGVQAPGSGEVWSVGGRAKGKMKGRGRGEGVKEEILQRRSERPGTAQVARWLVNAAHSGDSLAGSDQ
jgi:hypothetical protein